MGYFSEFHPSKMEERRQNVWKQYGGIVRKLFEEIRDQVCDGHADIIDRSCGLRFEASRHNPFLGAMVTRDGDLQLEVASPPRDPIWKFRLDLNEVQQIATISTQPAEEVFEVTLRSVLKEAIRETGFCYPRY